MINKRKLLVYLTAAAMAMSVGTPAFAVETDGSQPPQQLEAAEDQLIIIPADNVEISELEDLSGGHVIEASEEDETAEAESMVLMDMSDSDMGDDLEEAASILEADPAIEIAQPDYIYEFDDEEEYTPGEVAELGRKKHRKRRHKKRYKSRLERIAKLSKGWDREYIDLYEAWDFIDEVKAAEDRSSQPRVRIASLDSGADLSHPDLQANVDWETSIDVTQPKDEEGNYRHYDTFPITHGTRTAGVIGATSGQTEGIGGVAAGHDNDMVAISAIKVLSDDNKRGLHYVKVSDLIKGIEYAESIGAQVINICSGHRRNKRDRALEASLNKAVTGYGIVVCASAGNKRTDKAFMPGDSKECITVMNSINYRNAWGKCYDRMSNYGPTKDLCAPGSFTYTTNVNGSYAWTSGTSGAVAHVTGTVAMMLYVEPDLTVDQVKEILHSTASDIYKKGYDRRTGWGELNAYEAVAAAYRLNHSEIADTFQTTNETEVAAAPEMSFVKRTKGKKKRRGLAIKWTKVPRAHRYYLYRADVTGMTDESAESVNSEPQYKLICKTRKRSHMQKRLKKGHTYQYKIFADFTTKDGKKSRSEAGYTTFTK